MMNSLTNMISIDQIIARSDFFIVYYQLQLFYQFFDSHCQIAFIYYIFEYFMWYFQQKQCILNQITFEYTSIFLQIFFIARQWCYDLNTYKQYPVQNMKHNQTIYRLLRQNYRQFIQFINDLTMPTTLYIILMYIPSITIFGDLFRNIQQQNFLHKFSNLSISELLIELSYQIPAIFMVIKVFFLIALSIPLSIVGIIVIVALINSKDNQVQISYFYHLYNYSNICKIIRIYFSVYQHIFYPVFISIGIKFTILTDFKDIATGVIIMILGLLNSLLFHYYTLEIPTDKSQQVQYQYINFPNPLIETTLIFITIILINTTSGIVPFIACLCLFMLRTLIGHFLKFYHQQLYNENLFYLLFCCSISLGLLIGYISNQFSIMVVFMCITIAILFKAKIFSKQSSKNYIVISEKSENDQITVQTVKFHLRHQKIAQAFKEAVVISRKKNSHREDLMIDILKRKCYHLQSQSRGSTKMSNSLSLLQYEIRIVKIIKNILSIQQKAIQVLSIMKSKQPKQQMLIKNIVNLVDHIDQNKKQFTQCIKINSMASELNILIRLFFKHLYNDGIFLRQVNASLQDQSIKLNHKRIQKQLFSKDTALIVVKVIDQIGKISKVSNNLPNVLGYSSHSLIGLSINQLIPITIRQIHDQILSNFITNFTSQVIRQKHSIQFYAHNKDFHLQKIQIKYKFFLHNFETCELSSIVRKLKTQQYLILTDQYGNIQGWSSKIGDVFNFDELTGNDCNAYNLMPLLPSFIKFQNRDCVCLRTVFFRLSKMKNPKLMVFDFKKQKADIQDLKKKQLEVFFNLLQKGDIIQAFFIKVQMQVKDIKYDKVIKIFKINEMKRIQNFQMLQNAILDNNSQQKYSQNQGNQQKFDFNPNFLPEKSFQQSQDADFSILKTNSKLSQSADLNFSLDFNKQSVLHSSDLKLSKDIERFQSAIFSSRCILKIQTDDQKQETNYLNNNMTVQSNFNPKLQRKNNFVWLVVLIAMTILAVIIMEQINFSYVIQQMAANKTEIFNANRAQMIYCKSVFNPNQTYISQFNSGFLLMRNNWLFQQNTTYITSNGDFISENQFYLFNIQIPSNLDRILDYTTIPNIYKVELSQNFNNVISLYEKTYNNYKQEWSKYIDSIKAQCAYKMIAYSVAAIIYIIFVCFIQKRYKNQRKMTQAFFKFQKSDLDSKISGINSIIKTLHKRCDDWFLSQYLNQTKKEANKEKKQNMQADTISSLRKQSNTSQLQIGLKKNQLKELEGLEQKIVKNRFYCIIGIVIAIFTSQVLYLILHGVLVSNMLNSYKYIINKFDQANKLIVYPNLKLANNFYAAPPDVLASYQTSVQQTLNQPIENMPDLFNLLSQSPCSNCTFLSEILNTNYRSFYSYFMQVMGTLNSNATNITQLYYAVDVVTQNITKSLNTKPISNPTLLVLLYIFSLTLFFGSVFYITRQLNRECLKLQCFLKFFDIETLLKNKHMSTIMAKNT